MYSKITATNSRKLTRFRMCLESFMNAENKKADHNRNLRALHTFHFIQRSNHGFACLGLITSSIKLKLPEFAKFNRETRISTQFVPLECPWCTMYAENNSMRIVDIYTSYSASYNEIHLMDSILGHFFFPLADWATFFSPWATFFSP